MKPSRYPKKQDDGITSISYGSTSTNPSIYAPISMQSSVSKSTTSRSMSVSPIETNKTLNFDLSKIHGRQKESSILEQAVKSMIPGRKRRRNEISKNTQQETNDENHDTITYQQTQQTHAETAISMIPVDIYRV